MTRIPRGAQHFKWRRQRQENARRWPTLNLVALMDVFTILVFFFLVHSTDSTPQTHSDLLVLPESIADQVPRDTPVVTITRDSILLAGELIITIDEAMEAGSGGIEALHTALQAQLAAVAEEELKIAEEDAEIAEEGTEIAEDDTGIVARELTIMGDKTIPFAVLNRVMLTCTLAGYDSISLSVLQRPGGTP
jgi:biopolymer transport protein TolR